MDMAGNPYFGVVRQFLFFEREQDPTTMEETTALIDDESQDWLSDLTPEGIRIVKKL
jgi:hypothetical protein